MTVRVYLIPIVTVTDSRGHSLRVPKYFAAPGQTAIAGLEGLSFTGSDFGLEPVMMVVADVTPSQHTVLSTQSDVLALPADTTQLISAIALPTVTSSLEALKLPATWVTTANTYQQVLHVVLAIFQFAGRFQTLTGLSPFGGGFTLNSTISQLPAAARNGLTATAVDMGLSTAGVTGATTIRVMLLNVANQLPAYTIGGLTF